LRFTLDHACDCSTSSDRPGLSRHGYDQALAFDKEQSAPPFSTRWYSSGTRNFLARAGQSNFPTVFSSGDGVALSGVEIAATAFCQSSARRHDQTTAKTTWALIALLAGLICTALCLLLPNASPSRW